MKGDKLFENLIIGSIKTANVVLTGMDMLGGAIIDSFSFLLSDNNNETYIEEKSEEEELREIWEFELYHMTDEQLEEMLKERNLYYYSMEIDGRYKCREALIKDLVLNKKRPY